jgi:hypothetical protein
MSNPASRLARLLSESGRFSVHLPGQTSIDVTPDIVALVDEAAADSNRRNVLGHGRNLLETNDLGRDLATRVHFP